MRGKTTWQALGAVVAVAALLAVLLGRSTSPPLPPVRSYSAGSPLPSGRVTPKVQFKSGIGLLLAPDGTLWIWGGGMVGWGYQPGVPGWPSLFPRRFGGDSNWVDIAQGGHHGVGVRNDGSLWVWGEGPVSFAAIPKPGSSSTDLALPARVGPGTNWTAVAAGAAHVLALRRDGTVWGWGQNNYGELGDGTSGGVRSAPVRAQGDGYVRIAAGAFSGYALRADGALWAWGTEGGGSTNLVPGRVGGEAIWRSFAAGAFHYAAIRDDGSLWLGGGNSGLFEDDLRAAVGLLTPVRLGNGVDWVEVVAGNDQIYARKADGSWWGFGSNWNGQLGLGDPPLPALPPASGRGSGRVLIEGPVLSADADGETAVVLAPDGTLWTWGVRPGRNPRRRPWTPVVEFGDRLLRRLGLRSGIPPISVPPEIWWEPRPLWRWPGAE